MADTIFIVDDDQAARESLTLALTHRGYSARSFASAEDFLANLSADMRGCLILDVMMPGMSGLQLQAALYQRGHELPIIFVTAHGDIPMSVRAIRAGAVDFLEKPFAMVDLVGLIDSALMQDGPQVEDGAREQLIEARFPNLTNRERDVLNALTADTQTPSSKEVARRLGISHRTVEHHRARILEKTGTHSLNDLLRLVERLVARH